MLLEFRHVKTDWPEESSGKLKILFINEEEQVKVYHIQAETLFWSSRSGQISLGSSQPCKRKANSLMIQSL
jgi:hypothetical protein